MELGGLDQRFRDGKRLLGLLSMIKESGNSQEHFIQRKVERSSSDQALDQVKISDDKAARMVEVLSKQNFSKARHINQLRLTLVFWIIRGKISQNAKRAFDIMVGGLATIIASPIMLLTAIAIKLDSPGPVMFKQERVGKWGETFPCYKFRSMYADAEDRKDELLEMNEADEIVFKMKRDPRVTRVGRIIRKLSIDELPQLFNVLKGDMSSVGPLSAGSSRSGKL